MEFGILLAVIASAFCSGIVLMFFRELHIAKRTLEIQVKTFADITKQASEANTSLADKFIEFEKRLESVEFRTTAGVFGAKK